MLYSNPKSKKDVRLTTDYNTEQGETDLRPRPIIFTSEQDIFNSEKKEINKEEKKEENIQATDSTSLLDTNPEYKSYDCCCYFSFSRSPRPDNFRNRNNINSGVNINNNVTDPILCCELYSCLSSCMKVILDCVMCNADDCCSILECGGGC